MVMVPLLNRLEILSLAEELSDSADYGFKLVNLDNVLGRIPANPFFSAILPVQLCPSEKYP